MHSILRLELLSVTCCVRVERPSKSTDCGVFTLETAPERGQLIRFCSPPDRTTNLTACLELSPCPASNPLSPRGQPEMAGLFFALKLVLSTTKLCRRARTLTLH